MSADEIAHIIQSVLAPVVMITACAITVGGLMTHYGAVNDRLRTLMHERLHPLAVGARCRPHPPRATRRDRPPGPRVGAAAPRDTRRDPGDLWRHGHVCRLHVGDL